MHFRPIVLAIATAPLLATSFSAVPGTAAEGGRPLSTDLTGAEEVPAGDPDATGSADLALNQGQERVCFDISWADVDGDVVAAHIHEAPAGTNGGVVVPLFAGSFSGTDSASDCVDADKALVKDIRKNPTDYYVNVHSSVFPGGAVRGQLG